MHLSYGVCRLRVCMHLKTLSSLLKEKYLALLCDNPNNSTTVRDTSNKELQENVTHWKL